jgi:hypothetical protein
MRRVPLLPLVLIPLLLASRTDYLNIQRKFDAIEQNRVKAGTRVALLASELTAYAQFELPAIAPQGIRNPSVELVGNNVAVGHAMINFAKLRTANGKAPGWMMATLLAGEREVVIRTRIQSSGGTATVFLERVEVSGVPIEGQALDFLIDNYLIPRYPDAKINRPFELPYGIDSLKVSPGVAYVIMGR